MLFALVCTSAAAQASGGDLPAAPVSHYFPAIASNGSPSLFPDVPKGSASLKLPQDQPPTKFQTLTAAKQAMLFTGIMHATRYASQRETQDTLFGPFVDDYFQSVSELRGWDDSDTFATSYVLHPMEGATFGYIQVQNDPRYHNVEFGDGRDYWISRLRALAFIAALSTQWTLGPLSEASLGNVQLHDSPGFVDLVTTPTMGILWMFGEDALDHYLVPKFENRYSNWFILMLARSCFTPTRSAANLLAGRVPWYRDGKLGVLGANRATRKELLQKYHAGLIEAPFGRSSYHPDFVKGLDNSRAYPLAAPIELTTSAHYETFLGGGSCIGGGGSGAARINAAFQIVAEGSGCLILHQPQHNQSGDSETFVVGSRWTPRAEHHFSPYAQLLFGGRRITHEIDDETKRDELEDAWLAGKTNRSPLRSQWQVERQGQGAALAAGAGFDYVINRAFAWRVANIEYTHTWIAPVDNIRASESLKITSGVVLRIGTW
jgi:hypothetical protein